MAFSIQLRNYQIDFIRENKDLFPMNNPNVWFRKLVDNKIKEEGFWKEEFEDLKKV
jgi:hypothetical protein